MIRIALDPIPFYGLGWIRQQESALAETSNAEAEARPEASHWLLFQLQNSIWRSIVFRVPVAIDEMMAEELTNILASRISTALAKTEETWIGISPPHAIPAALGFSSCRDPETRIEFEFRYANNTIPVVACLQPREIAHA